MVKGSQKGAAFERWVCERLSRLVDPHSKETHFWRTSMSGGRATLQRRQRILNTAQLGDISAITRNRRAQQLTRLFLIECKHVKNLRICATLFKSQGELYRFWAKLTGEAESCSRCPLLIARQNNFGTLLVLDYTGYMRLLRLYPYVDECVIATLPTAQTLYFCWFKSLCQTEDFK